MKYPLHSMNITLMSLVYFTSCLITTYVQSRLVVPKDASTNCTPIAPEVLEHILGPAFNSKYMSVVNPLSEYTLNAATGKRKAAIIDDLSVDVDLSNDLFDDAPAWSKANHARYYNITYTADIPRGKRYTPELSPHVQEFTCKSTATWRDLGEDYFPRFLKSIECSDQSCWFGLFKCRPRAFSVKILRRRNNKCVKTRPLSMSITEGLPKEFLELWVWEEVAVTFCCECRS